MIADIISILSNTTAHGNVREMLIPSNYTNTSDETIKTARNSQSSKNMF